MSPDSVLPGDERRRGDELLPLDRNTAERLLVGTVPPADAPPGYESVARVLQAVAQAPRAEELDGEVDAVRALSAAIRAARPARPRKRRSAAGRGFPLRSGVAAAAAGLALTSGLAVAGALPGPARRAAAEVLHQLGLPLPAAPSPAPVAEIPATTTATGSPRAASPAPRAVAVPSEGVAGSGGTGSGSTPPDGADPGFTESGDGQRTGANDDGSTGEGGSRLGQGDEGSVEGRSSSGGERPTTTTTPRPDCPSDSDATTSPEGDGGQDGCSDGRPSPDDSRRSGDDAGSRTTRRSADAGDGRRGDRDGGTANVSTADRRRPVGERRSGWDASGRPRGGEPERRDQRGDGGRYR